MASGLLIKQKQLLAGSGISIQHGAASTTISSTVDDSRLLPVTAQNNELPVKKVGTDGTYLLLHFDETGSVFPADSSPAGAVVINNSTQANENGKFSGCRYLNNGTVQIMSEHFYTADGDFTYDGWFKFSTTNRRRALFGTNMGLYVAVWEDNTFGVAMSTDGNSWTFNYIDSNRSTATIETDVWTHIALVRNGNVLTLYKNGTSILSFGVTGSITTKMQTDSFYIGMALGGMNGSTDYVDEFRFSNLARWTGNFTPPESPYTVGTAHWEGISVEELADKMGAVRSVNNQTPDASGNVTIETGSSVDESRLLPENASNNELAIKKVGDAGIDTNTFLMLHFDEESGTPIDSSQSLLAINAGDTAVYSNGKFSRARNLNNSYLSTTCSAMATGAGNFTYDGWFYLTSTSKRRGLFTSGSNCVCFAAWEDNKFALGLSSTGNGWAYDHFDNNRFDFTFSANVWYHIAVVRNGNTLTVYVNGNSISSFDVSNLDVPAVSGTDAFKIGYPLGGMSNSTDIVDEFRFSNVARWTENFTPPDHAYTSASEYWESITPDDLTSLMDANKLVPAISEQDVGKFLSVAGSQVQEGNDENTFLLLHFDGNTNDSSDNARSDISAAGVSYVPGKFNQAAQFTGSTSSYVAIPNTSEFPFAGDFTISFWAKANSSDRFGILFYESDFTFGIDTIDNVYSVWASSNGSNWDILQADSSYSSSLTSDSGRGSIAITPGEWQHIAFVRSGNDWYLFVNGTMSLHKQRSGAVYNPQEQLRLARHANDSINAFDGLIDEFKIDTIARWTSNFTPPEHAYDSFISEGIHTEFTDINENIDAKISTHNADTSAHPGKLSLTGGQMTGELKVNATNALRINNGDYGVILRKDASSFYIMVTAQGDPNGGYTEARPLKIDLATGVCSINGGAATDSLGNVITTTYAPLNHPAFSNGVEILGTTPYIDFHYNNSESDYTFRIVQNSEDTLTLGGKVSISNDLTVTSGGMSVAGGIKNTGEIQSETTNSYRLVYGNYGTFWRNDGNALYLMLTDSGNQYGVYNSLRPLTVDLDTGVCDISGSAVGTESKLSSTGVYPRVSMNTTATADFNTFKTQGNYWFALGARPNGPLGDSTSTTGVLSVYNIQNTHTLQVYNMYSATGASTQQMYYRWCYGGTWTSWNRITPNAACTPNVGSAVDCTSALKSSAGYTCPSDGWIYADGTQLNINGGNFYTSRLPMVPVMSGDVVKCSDATIGEFYAAR